MTDTVRYDVDPQLRAEFIDAALESLTGLGNLFVQLEADPARAETVEAIFRVAHSIKGNAAFFELMKAQALAHATETLLDRIRKGQAAPARDVIDTLLAATDELAAMFARARANRPEVEDPARFEAILARLRGAGLGEAAVHEDLWRVLLDSLNGLAESRTLDHALELANRAREAARQLSAARVEAGAALWPEPAARLRDLLAAARPQEVFDNARAAQVGALLQEVRGHVAGEEALTVFDEAVGCYRLFLDTIGVDPVLREVLGEALGKVAALGAWKKAPPAPAPRPADERPKTDGPALPAAKTMRVSEESIDAFLSYVADLEEIGGTYRQIHTRLAALPAGTPLAEEARRTNETFEAAAARLRRSVLEIRKIPLHTLLQRVPRIVRDIATATGKEIEVHMEGETMLVDKSLVDTLEPPLVHLVRNAADHGIEPPDAREAAGKTRTGVIDIAATETTDAISLSVRDDGRGIDFLALRRQAAALGLAPAEGALSSDDTVALLFKSGVTTAAQVTEISGRGVGLDVVRRGIEAMGGSIAVATEPGCGSTFTIQLPKTVGAQILTGFIANVGGERFVLPMDRVVQYFRPQPGDLRNVRGRGKCILHRGELVAVRRLGEEAAGQPVDRKADLSAGFLIVVESHGRHIALHADDVEGIRQVVLPRGEAPPGKGDLFLGTALVGNGPSARVVDVDRLAAERA